MESAYKDVLECGMEKLTSGAGGCSNYAIKDVRTSLGNSLKRLKESCRLLNSEDENNQTYNLCVKMWEEVGKSLENGIEPGSVQVDLCQFAFLVTLMSNKIGDTRWANRIDDYLGYEQNLPSSNVKGPFVWHKLFSQ